MKNDEPAFAKGERVRLLRLSEDFLTSMPSSEGYALAELSSGGEQYVLRATLCLKVYDAVVVHADRPNRWEVI